MACLGSFPFSYGEKHPTPKSGHEVDPDKLGWTTSCRGDKTDPCICMLFSGFLFPITDSAN